MSSVAVVHPSVLGATLHIYVEMCNIWASQVVPVVKNLPANAGDVRDTGLIPGSGRSPGGAQGNPLQCSCLENPMDRGAWRLQSMGSQSQTQLSDLAHTMGLKVWA